MLPKRNRVDRKTATKIFKTGRFVNSENLTLKFVREGGNGQPRISFVAPKTVAKNSSQRNLLRRRGYKATEKYIHKFPGGFLGLFIFKKSNLGVEDLDREIQIALGKI